jgi:hypothetical protein
MDVFHVIQVNDILGSNYEYDNNILMYLRQESSASWSLMLVTKHIFQCIIKLIFYYVFISFV